jgi:ArsR family transcriptional regulator
MTTASTAARKTAKTPAPRTAKLPHARQTALFKALADPHRFQLLQQIAKAARPLACAQARTALPIAAATLSHHIKELESAGLIEVGRQGKCAYLSLRPGVLAALAASLAALETAGRTRP